MEFKEVNKKTFFDIIGPKNVHPSIINEYQYPYSSNWKLRNGDIIGKTVDYYPEGKEGGNVETKYYLILRLTP